MAVSYTHLDVYKRQLQKQMMIYVVAEEGWESTEMKFDPGVERRTTAAQFFSETHFFY